MSGTALRPGSALPPDVLDDLTRFAHAGTTHGIVRQLSRLGGCTNPIRLGGHSITHSFDPSTGELGDVIRSVASYHLPAGCLLTACGNRRGTRCPACSETYRRDTYHLITAGLAGGKNVPETVGGHPRVFATLTAPSFGPVHNRPDERRPCRCGVRHRTDDPALGAPLDPASYDYTRHVLWNANAGRLWARFTDRLRRTVAASAGLSRREFGKYARLSFAKVAEYQKRGAVHFHAVIRLDGVDRHNPNVVVPPPAWATVGLLDHAIRVAAASARVPGPDGPDLPDHFAWGRQVDVRPIRGGELDGGTQLTDRAVAGYIAKYATKGAEATTGTLDRRLNSLLELDGHDLTDHARTLIETAWRLDDHPALAELGLHRWAHMLGFRGHFTTKSRRYSTTLGALRAARAAWREEQARAAAEAAGHPMPDPGTTLVLAHWAYVGQGLSPGETWLANALAPHPEGEDT